MRLIVLATSRTEASERGGIIFENPMRQTHVHIHPPFQLHTHTIMLSLLPTPSRPTKNITHTLTYPHPARLHRETTNTKLPAPIITPQKTCSPQ